MGGGGRPDTAVRRRRHTGVANRRVAISGRVGAIALVVAVAVAVGASWPIAALVGWDASALVFTAWVGLTVAVANDGTTARLASLEDSRPAGELILICAGIASLLVVGFALARAGHAPAPARGGLIALAVGSVVVGWSSVHAVYLLRDARLYYSPPVGGIDFHGQDPDYRDFTYLALTIAMTFQVSDTDLMSPKLRDAAIHHALLSYLFGMVIGAITINLVANLLAT